MTTQKSFWFLLGVITPPFLVAVGGFVFIKTASNGFSARAQPSMVETVAAQTARSLAYPAAAKGRANPVTNSSEVLVEASTHWADHCASCHANDGSGEGTMGQKMYPPAPDMRKEHTQRLSDGELFYIIENGIRLSGMPAWGNGSKEDEENSWKLVHFIRHLPSLTPVEIKEMEKLNPQSPHELEEQRQEEEFLKGKAPSAMPKDSHH